MQQNFEQIKRINEVSEAQKALKSRRMKWI